MNTVNWDLAPEGAKELVQFESHVTWRKGIKIWCMVQQGWRDYVSDFKTIATRPTQKTVADAVEQEGEKWTHGIPPDGIYCKVNHGGEFVNCYLVGRDDMGAFVYRIDDQYHSTISESNLRPIKPKLTKAQAWDIIQEMHAFEGRSYENCYLHLFKSYDIVEGPAND